MGVKLSEMTIDVWMQHPTKRFLAHDMFDSLRRWTGEAIPESRRRSTSPSPRWTPRACASASSARGTGPAGR
jgi:hypothetical protein